MVAYDENEEFVTATYRCHEGYKLKGKSAITCELDTDEWQESPPSCEEGRNKKFELNENHFQLKIATCELRNEILLFTLKI